MSCIKPTIREFKPDLGDIVRLCLLLPLSLVLTILILYLPTIGISYHYSFNINQQNILKYYIVALCNVIFIALFHFVSEWCLLGYNIEYKNRRDDSVSVLKREVLIIATFGSVSSRLITSVVYLIILIISHLQDLNIYIIDNDFVAQLIQINKFSFIILTAIDKVLGEFRETKNHFKYKVKRWLELFLMYRLKIMQGETLKRIEELFAKKRYKAIFYEFGYVLDTINGGCSYYDFIKKGKSIDKDTFCMYYLALCNDSLIISEKATSVDEIVKYVRLNISEDVYKKIVNNICYISSVSDTIHNLKKLLQPEGYSAKIIYDEDNKNIILSIAEQKGEGTKK